MKKTLKDAFLVSTDTAGVVLDFEAAFGVAEGNEGEHVSVMKLVDRKTGESRMYMFDPARALSMIVSLGEAALMAAKRQLEDAG